MSLLDDLLERRVVFVTGKGGVGKSSVSAALAVAAHGRGMRVLLVDVDGRGDAARYLDGGPSSYHPREPLPGLSHIALEPEQALDEYLKAGLKVPRIAMIGPLHRVFDFIATAAPGVAEILVAGKVGYEARAMEGSHPRWDIVVVDAAPSGQVLSHLRAPRTISETVRAGLIHSQAEMIQEIIEDPRKTAILAVALAEEMPAVETAELVANVRAQVTTPVVGIVANRIVRPVKRIEGPLAEPLKLWMSIAKRQKPHLDALHEIGPPVTELPWITLDPHGLDATRRLAALL